MGLTVSQGFTLGYSHILPPGGVESFLGWSWVVRLAVFLLPGEEFVAGGGGEEGDGGWGGELGAFEALDGFGAEGLG